MNWQNCHSADAHLSIQFSIAGPAPAESGSVAGDQAVTASQGDGCNEPIRAAHRAWKQTAQLVDIQRGLIEWNDRKEAQQSKGRVELLEGNEKLASRESMCSA